MKASLKFREEQKPLFKAKVPLNILGFPFQSSLSTGDSKELSLSLSTFFDSGPAFRFSYRPNDAFNPFSLIVKTGIGHFGSPIDAPMTMSAQFNFPSGNSNSTPAFFLHFKPQFGDFSLKKLQQSKINGVVLGGGGGGGVDDEEDGSIEVVEKPINEFFTKEKITSLPLKSSVEEAMAGMELGAKTVLPIKNDAVLKLRWGVKFPQGFQSLFAKNSSGNNNNNNWTARMWPRRIPLLVLNKISIEHVAKEDKKEKGGPQVGGGDVAERCFAVKRELETLRCENAVLGKAMEDLRAEIIGGGKGRGKGHVGERKSPESDVSIDDVSKV